MRDWRDQAACRDVDPEIFFPLSEKGAKAERDAKSAKTYCRACPVNVECFEQAIELEQVGSRHGVWGGTTPDERDVWESRERNARRRAARKREREHHG